MKNINNHWYAIVRIDAGQKEVNCCDPTNVVAISDNRDVVFDVATIFNKEIGNNWTPTTDEVMNSHGAQNDRRRYAIGELTLTPQELEKFDGKIVGRPGFHLTTES
jgi:hypothetical protein